MQPQQQSYTDQVIQQIADDVANIRKWVAFFGGLTLIVLIGSILIFLLVRITSPY